VTTIAIDRATAIFLAHLRITSILPNKNLIS